jgi:hypothetical protein
VLLSTRHNHVAQIESLLIESYNSTEQYPSMGHSPLWVGCGPIMLQAGPDLGAVVRSVSRVLRWCRNRLMPIAHRYSKTLYELDR